MSVNEKLLVYEEKMVKRIDELREFFSLIRAGRANPAILNKLTVEYYGAPTPITQLASVMVSDARTIVIQPWEATVLKDMEKAILASDIGLNPNNDGKCIRLNFPSLTEERRKELSKQTKKYAEEAKISVRNVRRDAIESAKKRQKASEISEDDLKVLEKDIQKLTDTYCEKIEKILSDKEKEIMEV